MLIACRFTYRKQNRPGIPACRALLESLLSISSACRTRQSANLLTTGRTEVKALTPTLEAALRTEDCGDRHTDIVAVSSSHAEDCALDVSCGCGPSTKSQAGVGNSRFGCAPANGTSIPSRNIKVVYAQNHPGNSGGWYYILYLLSERKACTLSESSDLIADRLYGRVYTP